MNSSFLPAGVCDGNLSQHQPEVRRQVSLALECTEAAGLSYVQDHFSHPSENSRTSSANSRSALDQSVSATNHRRSQPNNHSLYSTQSYDYSKHGDTEHTAIQSLEHKPSEPRLARVKLTKEAAPREATKFFVRSAGGMSVPMPDYNDAFDKPTVPPEPQTASRSQTNNEGKSASSGYLPLSVELIAGRGQTSMPSDGHKNAVNPKVRSVPPSQTLALSASFIKSYFTSGGTGQPGRGVISSTPDAETVKTKVMGLWNNVKYGWTVNLKTNFSRDSPVYLLGNVYHKSLGEEGEDAEESQQHGMEWFKRHFHTLIWCTYRRQFPALQDSSLTTDCGWGCMLRSGQMMLSHALTRHFLFREWRYDKSAPTSSHEETIHRSIVRWLGDVPSPHCPLSLHNLVHLGRRLGKKAGDWYGPASAAYICKEAVEMGSKYIPDLKRVCVYVAQDCAVYVQDVLDLCSTSCICDFGLLSKLAEREARSAPNSSPYTPSNSHTEGPISKARPLSNPSYTPTNSHNDGSISKVDPHRQMETLLNAHPITHAALEVQSQIHHFSNTERTSKVPSHKQIKTPLNAHPTSLTQVPEVQHNHTNIDSIQSHTQFYSQASSYLPNQSTNINVTRIKVGSDAASDANELPTRLYISDSGGQTRQNGECHTNPSVLPSECMKNKLEHTNIYPSLGSLNEVNHSVSNSKSSVEISKEQEKHPSVRLKSEEKVLESGLKNSSNTMKEQKLDSKLEGREESDVAGGSTEQNVCPKCENWRSVLIMVPVRLGGESLNPMYAPCIYSLFTHDLSVGIIGGRPKHSLYFVGFQEDSLIHLDPHLVQDAVMVTQPNFPLTSYHCQAPRKMALSRMDPSATLGFYCHTRTDFFRLMEELPEMVTPKQPGFEYPIFEFVDGRSEDSNAIARQVTCEDQLAANLPNDTPLLPQDSEEFVFL